MVVVTVSNFPPTHSCSPETGWPLGLHEVMLHPSMMEQLGVPCYGHVAVRSANQLRLGQEPHLGTTTTLLSGVVMCRALPDATLATDAVHVSSWMKQALSASHLTVEKVAMEMKSDTVWRIRLEPVKDIPTLQQTSAPIPAGLDLGQAVRRRLNGYLICAGALIGMQILGRLKLFRVTAVQSVENLIQRLKEAVLESGTCGIASSVQLSPVMVSLSTQFEVSDAHDTHGHSHHGRCDQAANLPTTHQARWWATQVAAVDSLVLDLFSLISLSLYAPTHTQPPAQPSHTAPAPGRPAGPYLGRLEGVLLPPLPGMQHSQGVLPPNEAQHSPVPHQRQLWELVPRGVLLYGGSGVGKTVLLRALCDGLRARGCAHVCWLQAGAVLDEFTSGTGSGRSGPSFQALQEVRRQAPSVVVLDHLDVLFDALGSDGDAVSALSEGAQAAAHLLAALDELWGADAGTGPTPSGRVVVLGATRRHTGGAGAGGSSSGLIPPSFCRVGRFERTVHIPAPTEAGRTDVLRLLLSGLRLEDAHGQWPADPGPLPGGLGGVDAAVSRWAEGLSRLTPGFVGGDLVRLLRCAHARAARRARDQGLLQQGGELALAWEDVQYALTRVVPYQLQDVEVCSVPRGLSWQSLAGYSQLKDRLRKLVQGPWLHPETFRRMGIGAVSGVLLHGPSGCGKSLIAQVLASECRANFIWVRSSELFSRYLGESEAAVRRLFARARDAAPSILFFDELDAITASRDSMDDAGGAESVYLRVLSTLLNEMDGITGGPESGASSSVLILGATNRREALDAALLRPGRLHESIHVALPSVQDRREILQLYTSRIPLGQGADIDTLASDLNSQGLTGADLQAVCREASMMALRRDIGATSVSAADLSAALHRRRQTSLTVPGIVQAVVS